MDVLRIKFLNLRTKMKDKPTEATLNHLADLFRELRTQCASNVEIRKSLFDSIIQLKSMKEMLEVLHSLSSDIREQSAFQCFKIGLQVIGNAIVQNDLDCVKHIWDELQELLKDCYKDEYGDRSLNKILTMIFYNVYKVLPNISEDFKVRDTLIREVKMNNEFGFFFLDDFINPMDKSETKFLQFFNSLDSQQKAIVLEYTKSHSQRGLHMDHFVNCFNRDIFRIVKDEPCYSKDEALATVINLELLTELSTLPDFREKLQNNGTFVSNIFEFLKTMHALGKKDTSNNFAPDPHLGHMFDPQTLRNEPCYGLKSTCVNLVANLCWEHCANQDYARTCELLPVLLECCNIDAKNPLLKEYAVFAIANCCKNNPSNQEYIAQLNKQGEYSFDSQSGVNLAPGVNMGTLRKQNSGERNTGRS